MFVRKSPDEGRCDGLEEREHGAQSSPEKDNVIAIADGARKRLFVRV